MAIDEEAKEKIFEHGRKLIAEQEAREKRIEAKVKRKYKTFDDKRKKLAAAYMRATTPRKRLTTLAAVIRQHGEYMGSNIFMSGWVSDAVISFAEHVEGIAEDLE